MWGYLVVEGWMDDIHTEGIKNDPYIVVNFIPLRIHPPLSLIIESPSVDLALLKPLTERVYASPGPTCIITNILIRACWHEAKKYKR